MKKAILGFLMMAVLLGVSLPELMAAGPYDKYLTVADVEQVSGLSGLKIVPKDPSKGAGGNLNFATADGKLVVMANFLSADYFKDYKKQPHYIKAPVDGVGEEAYSGPERNPQYVLFFRKGTHCVTLSSFFNICGKTPTMLTMDQLIALGKVVAARLE